MQLIAAIILLVLAGLIWLVFLRPLPTTTAAGVVAGKSYKPPGEYTQMHGGTREAFHLPTKIPIAEGYVIDIELDNDQGSLRSLLNTVEAEQYQVGSRVQVEYSVRSVPGIWQKCYVHSVQLIEPAAPPAL